MGGGGGECVGVAWVEIVLEGREQRSSARGAGERMQVDAVGEGARKVGWARVGHAVRAGGRAPRRGTPHHTTHHTTGLFVVCVGRVWRRGAGANGRARSSSACQRAGCAAEASREGGAQLLSCAGSAADSSPCLGGEESGVCCLLLFFFGALLEPRSTRRPDNPGHVHSPYTTAYGNSTVRGVCGAVMGPVLPRCAAESDKPRSQHTLAMSPFPSPTHQQQQRF